MQCIYTTLLVKYQDLIFLREPGDLISIKWACMKDLEPSYAYVNFLSPTNSVN